MKIIEQEQKLILNSGEELHLCHFLQWHTFKVNLVYKCGNNSLAEGDPSEGMKLVIPQSFLYILLPYGEEEFEKDYEIYHTSGISHQKVYADELIASADCSSIRVSSTFKRIETVNAPFTWAQPGWSKEDFARNWVRAHDWNPEERLSVAKQEWDKKAKEAFQNVPSAEQLEEEQLKREEALAVERKRMQEYRERVEEYRQYGERKKALKKLGVNLPDKPFPKPYIPQRM